MRFLRLNETAKRVGYHPVHLRRLWMAGKFPKPVRLGDGAIAHVEDEVTDWQKGKIAERDADAAETEAAES